MSESDISELQRATGIMMRSGYECLEYGNVPAPASGDPTADAIAIAQLRSERNAKELAKDRAMMEAKPPPQKEALSDDILQQWVEAIEVIPYRDSKRRRQKAGFKEQYKGTQNEHFIPNSSFIVGKGRNGPRVAGAEGYSQEEALTYAVEDGQSPGSEHRWLTTRERAFCFYHRDRQPPTKPTLGEWLDFMEVQTAASLVAHRHYDPIEQKAAAAQKAAAVVRKKCEERYLAMGIGMDTVLENGMVPKNGRDTVQSLPENNKGI